MVVGAFHGKGKRTNVYGAFLLACYNADDEEWQTIFKIGTGFSDEDLQKHAKTLRELEIGIPRGDLKVGGAKADVWFQPKVVWGVLAADLSLSPVYTAAQGVVSMSFVVDSLILIRGRLGRCKGYLPPFPSLHSRAERTRMPTTLPWVGVLECLEIYRWEPLAIT